MCPADRNDIIDCGIMADEVVAVKIERVEDDNSQRARSQMIKNDDKNEENVLEFDELSPPDRKSKRRKSNVSNVVNVVPDKAELKVGLGLTPDLRLKQLFRPSRRRSFSSLEFGEKMTRLGTP